MRRPTRLRGRGTSTVIEFEDEAVWVRSERLTRLARQSPDLPSFYEAEFMFMGTARDPMGELAIHLDKQYDTRRDLTWTTPGTHTPTAAAAR